MTILREKLRDKVLSPDFPWFFQEGKSELYDGFRYGHSVWMPLNALVTPLSFELYNLIAPIINKSPLLKFKVSKILRSSLVIIAKIPKTEISNPDI